MIAAVALRKVGDDLAVLLGQRPPGKRHGGLWEVPGGKVEPGESDEAAAVREMSEELGVKVVHVGAVLTVQQDEGSPYLIVYRPVEIAGNPRSLEHTSLVWATRSTALTLPLAPADAHFVTHHWPTLADSVAP